jgi:hypothetical protein
MTTDTQVWVLVEGYETAGIEARIEDGQKYYRARFALQDDNYPGEQGPKFSPEYRALDAADAQLVGAYDVINPLGLQQQRNLEAAVIRSHMQGDQAAMSDMRKHLANLEADLLYPYRQWMQEQERIGMRRAASDQEIAHLLQIDVELMTGEQRRALRALLSSILKEK